MSVETKCRINGTETELGHENMHLKCRIKGEETELDREHKNYRNLSVSHQRDEALKGHDTGKKDDEQKAHGTA